jgi:DNA-binding CsgD family transcriptional regulator
MTNKVFDALLDSIYAAAEDQNCWELVLSSLASHLSARGGVFHARSERAGFAFGTTTGLDQSSLKEYADYFYSVNPLNTPLSRIPVGVATPDHLLIPRREIERTEFFNDYARTHDVAGSITLVLARDTHQEVSFGIVRDVRSDLFTLEQVSFVQRLGPHILRAVSLNRRLAALVDERGALEGALDRLQAAILLLDEKGAIHHCNCAATELLKEGDGIASVQGRLVATSAKSQAHFAELVRAAANPRRGRGGSSFLLRKRSARPLFARVMPFGQRSDFWLSSPIVRAIVFISDPDRSNGDAIAEVMDLYGLTPSEKKFLSELLAGSTVQEAADALNITRATGRNRLARIMAKTDTNRQGELLQLIHQSSSPTR